MGFHCSFCKSDRVFKAFDLGEVALAGAFLRAEQIPNEQKYVLDLQFCSNCFMFQVGTRPDKNVVFSHYFYSSSVSNSLSDHFREFAGHLVSALPIVERNLFVAEIGCNDGILLKPLRKLGIQRLLGIDPATNIVERIDDPEIPVINDFFSEGVARAIVSKYGKVDVLLANNVFAHIDDISDVLIGVEHILSEEGIFIFENHYLRALVDQAQFDMIYHEHVYYYSATSVSRAFTPFGLRLVDVEKTPTHGGSMRFYVRRGASVVGPSLRLRDVLAEESLIGISELDYYTKLGKRMEVIREELRALVNRLRAEGRRVCGYGASGRANTIIQYCGFSTDHIAFMIDDSPLKQGYLTPGSHIPIVSNNVEYIRRNADCIIIFAWAFREEILRRLVGFKGLIVVPLPEVEFFEVDL